jgi:hypothetical protein
MSRLTRMPGIFNGFPIQLVFGHLLDCMTGQNELPASWFLQAEKLP